MAHWIYLKIYTGTRTADHILSKILFPFWKQHYNSGNASDWFFIRYSDPEFHVRFRMKLSSEIVEKEAVEHLNDKIRPCINAGLVWNVERAVYMPEYERYGKDCIEEAEQLFCSDSTAVMNFLGMEHNLDKHGRWLYAIASINCFLRDFNYKLEEKKSLLLNLNRSFGKEFGKDKKLATQLSDEYRNYHDRILNVLNNNEPFNTILDERSLKQKGAVNHYLNYYEEGLMTITKKQLLSSFIHMSLNRIFRTNNRLHEMVIYDLLFRAYKESFHRKLKL